MRAVMGILSALLGIYSLLIIIRIMLTWFVNARFGGAADILARITDPYLNWFRRNINIRAGFMDLSPIIAMAVLSVAQTLCDSFAKQGTISAGIILAVCLLALWSAVSFLLGFCLIVLIVRLVGYLAAADIYSPFWRIIDSISRPILYRINRIVSGGRITGYLAGIITAIAILAAAWILGRIGVALLTGLLLKLPF